MKLDRLSLKAQTTPPTRTDEEKLHVVFKKICGFCAHYNGLTKAVNAGSPESLYVSDLLERFSIYQSKLFPDIEKAGLTIQIPKAKPSMPRVPWVAVVQKGRFVATSISVAICFGRTGNGAVVGLMQPSSSGLPGAPTPVIRSADREMVVNVDGNNPGTYYNDRFINPKEFLASNLVVQQLLEHFEVSLKLLQRVA